MIIIPLKCCILCRLLLILRVMILDVTRHKFSEALLTLLFFAAAITAGAVWIYPLSDVEVGSISAPLAHYIAEFQMVNPLISAVFLGLLFMYMIVRLSRTTVRVSLYPATTLAAFSVTSVLLFGALTSANYGILAMCALFVAEAFSRLMYCFSPSLLPHYLFSAMMALGALPLFDSAFVPLAIVVPLFVIISRATLRETVLVLLGITLPTFIYCYVVWLFGGNFVDSFMAVWGDDLLLSRTEMSTYLTPLRLVYLGVVLFLQLFTSVLYVATPLTLSNAARDVWRVMQLAVLVLLASLLLLPAASPAIVVALALLTGVMLPLLLQHTSMFISILLYILLFAVSFLQLF